MRVLLVKGGKLYVTFKIWFVAAVLAFLAIEGIALVWQGSEDAQ